MKLIEVEIADFRGIKELKLNFCDELGRIQDRIPIIGPNTSGKTSILDAIALSLTSVTELYQLRDGLPLSSSSIVRRGATQSRVSCTVWFSDEELASAQELEDRLGAAYPYRQSAPKTNEVKVHWQFPDMMGKRAFGYYRCEPEDGWVLFKPRLLTARSLHVPGVGVRDFQERGGVFMLDQQRTGLAMRAPSEQMSLAQGARLNGARASLSATGEGSDDIVQSYTSDARQILINLATRAQATQAPKATAREDYERLCELYKRVCQPHQIRGLYNAEYGLDMEFEGPGGVYYFDGLSSGQQMLLLMLLHFATRRIHRSIVLIDELELHLHPLWQSRLYHALRELGADNQYFFTTHSTYLRDLMRDDFFHATGDLGDGSFAKAEV